VKLEESFDLPCPRETAWAAFQDVAMLVSCLPGASLASEPEADPLELGFAVKLGPIAANFTGQGKLAYESGFKGRLSGGGTDRGTGSRVKGSATFELHEMDGGTQVRLSIDYALSGALGQFGRSGIVKEVAAGIARQFAANLRARLAAHATQSDAGASLADGVSRSAQPEAARLDAGALLWDALKTRIRGVRQPETAEDRLSGLDALLGVRPQWTALAPAAKLVALDGRWLLHAGPSLADPLAPPAPVMSSAVLACLYEGWATTEEQAERLVESGEIRLLPAQDYRCVTPLAALVTPATTMIVAEDGAGLVPPAYAPLGALGGADARFGNRDPAILERLAARDGEFAPTLAAALADPIDLVSIAAEAVGRGDDLHNRTVAATQALAARLGERFRGASPALQHRVERLLSGLAGTPGFFLTFWMAAAKLILSAAETREPRTLVTRMGGNGEAFGLSLAGCPGAWITVRAGAPRGAYLPGIDPDCEPLGAIGDSAVIDALGFGGQVLHLAPEVRGVLQPFLPPAEASFSTLLSAAHPAFAQTGVRVGLDALHVVEGRIAPVITLGMVERTGRTGLLGRGVYVPERDLFARAIRNLGE
jgi:carbon monoxide dehydrogenase subunit G